MLLVPCNVTLNSCMDTVITMILTFYSQSSNELRVCRMVEKVCKDPQMLVDIFVNYDCDLEAPNLFELMV